MANDPYTDDEYDDTYKRTHGDEPARDQYAGDQATDDTFFPSGVGGAFPPSGWGIWPSSSSVDADYDGTEGRGDALDERGRTTESARAGEDEDDGTWLDEGLIGLLLVAGVVLFLFPEPATSAVGVGLITIGLVAWVIDWVA